MAYVDSTLLFCSASTPDPFHALVCARIKKLSARQDELPPLHANAQRRKQTRVLRTSDKTSVLSVCTSFAVVSTSLLLILWDKCIYQGETVMCALRDSCCCPSSFGPRKNNYRVWNPMLLFYALLCNRSFVSRLLGVQSL
jgi:hypothetical protein